MCVCLCFRSLPGAMRITIVFLGLMLVTLAETLPHNVHARQKRGFRANSVDRVAHGYGKRAGSDRKHLYLSDTR